MSIDTPTRSSADWLPGEEATLRRFHTKASAAQLAAVLNRPIGSVRNRLYLLGLSKQRRIKHGASLDALLREKHAIGLSATETASELKINRRTVSARWEKLGLANQRFNERHRAKLRAKTLARLERDGLPSMGHIRKAAWAKQARELGWPEDLRPTTVQVLEALHRCGPLTRREICEEIGLPWHGSRRSLKTRDPEGSHLAHLAARGLVVNLGKQFKLRGRGRSQCVYALAEGVQPKREVA